MKPKTGFNEADCGSGQFSRGAVQEAVIGRRDDSRRAKNSTGVQAVAGTDNMGVGTAWYER